MAQGHLGPIQQFTEVCLACGQNVYASPACRAAPDPDDPREQEIARLRQRVAELEDREQASVCPDCRQTMRDCRCCWA